MVSAMDGALENSMMPLLLRCSISTATKALVNGFCPSEDVSSPHPEGEIHKVCTPVLADPRERDPKVSEISIQLIALQVLDIFCIDSLYCLKQILSLVNWSHEIR